jgi:uncharacterized repeat protein (TIGR01451 family)
MRKIYITLLLLTIAAITLNAQVNVTVTAPTATGACIQNLYTISFSGVSAGTELIVTPSLNVASSGSCPTTDGVAMEYESSANATLVTDGDKLKVTVNSTAMTTVSYYVLIDCHITGSNSVNLTQTFTSNNGTIFLIGGSNIHTTPNIKKPSIVLQNTTDFKASYLSNSFFNFYYRNNGDSANILFSFTPSPSGYCGQVSTDSIFFQNGLNGTQYPYTGTSSDTVILSHLDTLVIKQRVQINSCLSSCVADTAKLSWQCNYTTPHANNFCTDCKPDKYSYHVSNNDSARADVIRISPAKADREFSCFNDTATGITWKYIIVNTGRGAMDSLNFELMEYGTSGNTALINYLMLIDSSSVSITKGITSGCTLTTNLTTRSKWLCKDLVPKALYRAYVNIKNFGERDTIYISFTTMRCSEEDNAALLNKPKIYNWWYFNELRAKNICGTETKFPSVTGLFGSFISGQMTGTAYDDINLKLQYFPSVSNLSVDNSGMGDSALFSMDFKGLVRKSAVNIYQLLGCDTVQSQCDTLHGWLRATVFCDTNIRITRSWQDVYFIKTNANNDTVVFSPKYYYTSDTIGMAICRRTTYYFYFNLADSAMRNVLDSGKFVFKIQACCGSDLSPSPYSATFHLLPNPGNCFTLNYTGTAFASHLVPPDIINNKDTVQWVPLSERGKQIYVLCPGCKSPGIIAHSYRMQRAQQSLGLQDSDNDGRADEPLTQITDTSGWYMQYGHYINRNISSFGDRTEDFLLSNFVDGDKTTGGYDYGQLQQLGLRFNVLQLSRFIPMGQDTMNLMPDSLVFYIDDTTQTGSSCIDCDLFDAGGAYTTILKINAGSNDISKYFIGTSPAYNEYRYAFTSYYDSIANTYSGNLHDFASLITYTNNTFTGFLPSQHYRLRVFYSVCGNFSGGASTDADAFVKPSQITNRMFLSGNIHQAVSNNIPKQPNTVALLDSAGWTVDPNDVNNVLADTTFMNKYAFFCEATGAIHYFASTETVNGSYTQNTEGCKKLLTLRATSNITGGKDIYDAFPYEYKTPQLMPVHFDVNIPFGYYVSSAWVSNIINFPSGTSAFSFSDTVGIQLTDTVGNTVITDADLPPLQCFTQNNVQAGNDTLFIGDQYEQRRIDLQLMPLPQMCIDTLVKPAMDSTCVISFNIQVPSCLESGVCSQVNINKGNGQMNALGVNPDLIWSGITNSNALLNSDTVCWRGIKIENQNTTQAALTQADNVYLALIDSGAPYLSDWHFIRGAQVNYPNGNVIGVTAALPKGATVTGDLCARVAGCPNDTVQRTIRLHYGWNCNGYPSSPYDSTKICEYSTMQLTYKRALTGITTPGKTYETPYTLCDTVTVSAEFYSTELGYVYPDSVVLQNLDPGLQILSVSIIGTGAAVPLTPIVQPQVWLIGTGAMMAAGFLNGGINNGATFTLKIEFIPSCTFAGDTTLPDIVIFAHDFCNEIMSANANKTMNSTFRMSSVQSACNDCWSITKTASADTIAAGNTVTYTITVCNNSANTQTGVLADVLPNGFVQTNSTLPSSVTLNSMQCDTFTVSGYFTQTGSCFYNTASVTSPANTTWKDSVCVTVINPCTTTDTTFADSTTFAGINTITGKSILVAGTYYVNGTLTLNNCTVYVNAGGQIIVQTNGNLILNNTIVQSCDTMWRGIILNKSKITLTNYSVIEDANTGIEAQDGSSVYIDNGSKILNCVTGLYIPPQAWGLNNVAASISDATFAMTSTAFKPDYQGQVLHGNLPKAGIEIYSVPAFVLGGKVNTLNVFDKLNTGIVAHNSTVTVKNTKFLNIVTDSVYTEAYRGTAMVSVYHENIPAISNPKLTVLPENGTFKTVNNCWRGIYTDGSVLAASFINLLNVNQGVYGTRTPWLQTSMVNNCKITTQATGIFWTNNAYAKNMMAINDSISVNAPPLTGNTKAKGFSRGAIYMSEASYLKNVLYTATNNTITLNNAFYGISQNLTKNGTVKFNKIKINTAAPISTAGIALNGTQRVNASCNNITGSYPAAGLAYNTSAITASLAERSYIGCNTTDSTVTGIYFGGFNPATRLRGNSMNYHFEGLYLNKVAVIDSQPHGGNLWFGPFNNYGALNLAPTLLVYKSIFLIDPTAPSANFPINYSPAGWFQLTSGTTFDCGKTTLCSTPPTNNYTSDELKELIASGAFQTDEYMDESRAIAEEYLYRELREDSALWVNDSLYAAFIATNEDSVIGKLYEAEFNMDAAMQYDSVFNASMASIDSQTVAFENYISYMDSLAESGTPVINYETERQQTINTLAFLAQTKQNIIIQQEAMRDNKLQDAKLINDIIVPDELPQQNAQIINEIEIAFAEGNGNLDVIRNNYQNILNIAQQCPFAGGQSVFKARVLINLINDSVLYFDDDICLQSDIYRTGKMDSLQGSDIISSVKLMPNPANNKVTVLISGVKEGVCKINIENILSQPVLSAMLDCKKQQHTLDISKLSVGVYSVKIELNNNKYSTVKLVITR